MLRLATWKTFQKWKWQNNFVTAAAVRPLKSLFFAGAEHLYQKQINRRAQTYQFCAMVCKISRIKSGFPLKSEIIVCLQINIQFLFIFQNVFFVYNRDKKKNQQTSKTNSESDNLFGCNVLICEAKPTHLVSFPNSEFLKKKQSEDIQWCLFIILSYYWI